MLKSKDNLNQQNVSEVVDNEQGKNNGFYMETIKSQKKSFASRVLMPIFICILCLVLSVCACAITVSYVIRMNSIQSELPLFNWITKFTVPGTTHSPIPTQTNGIGNYGEDDKPDPESITTTYRNILRIEVIPYEVNSSISKAVERIMPSIAYLRCRSSDNQGAYITEASALIISDDGYMITADTVVEALCHDKSNELKQDCFIEVCVNYDYSNLYFARVIGRDKTNNVALIKIDTNMPLQFIEYGDSDKLVLGETMITASSGGHSVKGQVTTGIVSGLAHTYNDKIIKQNEKPKDDLYKINTTALMTSNNNGGALVNIKGQVVALTVYAKENEEPGSFVAIPINKIKVATENLEIKSYIESTIPNLGIAVDSDLTKITVSPNANETPIEKNAVKIKYVGFGTPAFYSGIKKDDYIVSIFDQPFSSVENFFELKNNYAPGVDLALMVYRYSSEFDDYIALPIVITQEESK